MSLIIFNVVDFIILLILVAACLFVAYKINKIIKEEHKQEQSKIKTYTLNKEKKTKDNSESRYDNGTA